jgi:hypothetical protein
MMLAFPGVRPVAKPVSAIAATSDEEELQAAMLVTS